MEKEIIEDLHNDVKKKEICYCETSNDMVCHIHNATGLLKLIKIRFDCRIEDLEYLEVQAISRVINEAYDDLLKAAKVHYDHH